MSTYKSLGELTCLIIQPLTLGNGVSDVSEVRFYESSAPDKIYTTDTTQVSIPYYGTWCFYVTNGVETSAKFEGIYEEAKEYEHILLKYFTATISVTTEENANVMITGPNGYSETKTAGDETSVTFTVSAAGDYNIKATKNGVTSNTASVTISTKNEVKTATCTFCKLSIVVDSGSSVTVTNSAGSEIETYTQGNFAEIIYLPTTDTYTVTATLNDKSDSNSVDCSSYSQYNLELAYRGLTPTMLTTIANAVSVGNLNSVSWASIEKIADAIVSSKATGDDITVAKRLLGLNKSFTYGSATYYAFVIGVCQDYYGSTKRGLTFWCVGSNAPFSTSSKPLHITTSKFRSSNGNGGGWGANYNDVLRTALQSDGTIYNNMPSDMRAIMKSKTTYYGPSWSSASTDVSSVTDTMFILSPKEIWNMNNANSISWASDDNRPYWQYEGTGAYHNEQYQMFANEAITFSNYSKLQCSTDCWLRTVSPGGNAGFMNALTNGSPNNAYVSSGSYGVAPAFCV